MGIKLWVMDGVKTNLDRRKTVKMTIALWAFLLSLCLTGVGHSAGGPMYEDLTGLAGDAQKAVDAGKRGDAEEFVKDAEAVLREAREHPDSAARQRIIRRLKKAIGAGQAGDLAIGTEAIEEAMTDMTKTGAPKFGGGS